MDKRIYFIALFLWASLAAAQTKLTEHIYTRDSLTDNPLTYSLNDMAWLSGSWKGEGLGGEVEEIWSSPKNGQMIGLFRYDSSGEMGFSEHCVITQTPNGIMFKVRHFSGDFIAWEDKEKFVEFPLIKITDQTAYYEGCTFIRDGDVLKIYVFIESDGVGREELFLYLRND